MWLDNRRHGEPKHFLCALALLIVGPLEGRSEQRDTVEEARAICISSISSISVR